MLQDANPTPAAMMGEWGSIPRATQALQMRSGVTQHGAFTDLHPTADPTTVTTGNNVLVAMLDDQLDTVHAPPQHANVQQLPASPRLPMGQAVSPLLGSPIYSPSPRPPSPPVPTPSPQPPTVGCLHIIVPPTVGCLHSAPPSYSPKYLFWMHTHHQRKGRKYLPTIILLLHNMGSTSRFPFMMNCFGRQSTVNTCNIFQRQPSTLK